MCPWCGGETADARDLADHQAWCLGEGSANVALLSQVAVENGEITQDALVAAARKRRTEGASHQSKVTRARTDEV